MPKIVLMQGLPASGKTTHALELVRKYGYTRVNKDDLRQMLHDGHFSKSNEKVVVETERTLVELAILNKKDIVIDNTHLQPKNGSNHHIEFYSKLASDNGYDFNIIEKYISVEDAIKRDANRENGVGEEVIRKFARRCILPSKFPSNPVFKYIDSSISKICIICDIDGTLAFMNGKRSPYDYSKVGGDAVNERLSTLLKLLRHTTNIEIIFVSGRKDDCRKETREWLDKNGFINSKLYMRKADDNRCDTIVKKEIYDKEINGKFNVLAVFDDRDRVVDMWRELGLPTYQVWYGAF